MSNTSGSKCCLIFNTQTHVLKDLKEQDGVSPVINVHPCLKKQTAIQLFNIILKYLLMTNKTKDLGTYFCAFATINSFCLALEHVATEYTQEYYTT